MTLQIPKWSLCCRNRKIVRNNAINSLFTSLSKILIFSYGHTTFDSSNHNGKLFFHSFNHFLKNILKSYRVNYFWKKFQKWPSALPLLFVALANSVVIYKTSKMIRAGWNSATNGNISEPSQRIDVVSISPERNGVFFLKSFQRLYQWRGTTTSISPVDWNEDSSRLLYCYL